MFFETVLIFKLTFGFSYVLFVKVVTSYHVDNVFGVAVNVELNVHLVSPSFATTERVARVRQQW